jgi:hypothetical protein
MRHAWLIIAHNEFAVLQRLLAALDNARNDFYVHIDRKVSQLPELRVEEGRLYLLKDRMDVRWGSVSQIAVELFLLETALKNGPYAHYHIISGVHLPLKPVEELLAFYDAHPDETLARFWPQEAGEADFKMRRYHFPLRHYKCGSALQRRVCQLAWQWVIKVQKVFGIRHLRGEHFVKTDNWLSLTEAACRYLVEHKSGILKKYRWSFCGDEFFAVTELSKCPELRILDCPELLYLEFQGDTPRTFSMEALPALQETRFLFARKFKA